LLAVYHLEKLTIQTLKEKGVGPVFDLLVVERFDLFVRERRLHVRLRNVTKLLGWGSPNEWWGLAQKDLVRLGLRSG